MQAAVSPRLALNRSRYPGRRPSSDFIRGRVAAKPFGFLESASPATRYLVLKGFARSNVAEVRVRYYGHGGGLLGTYEHRN